MRQAGGAKRRGSSSAARTVVGCDARLHGDRLAVELDALVEEPLLELGVGGLLQAFGLGAGAGGAVLSGERGRQRQRLSEGAGRVGGGGQGAHRGLVAGEGGVDAALGARVGVGAGGVRAGAASAGRPVWGGRGSNAPRGASLCW